MIEYFEKVEYFIFNTLQYTVNNRGSRFLRMEGNVAMCRNVEWPSQGNDTQ